MTALAHHWLQRYLARLNRWPHLRQLPYPPSALEKAMFIITFSLFSLPAALALE